MRAYTGRMKYLLPALALLLSACGSDEPPPPEPKAPEGRAETQSIRNTDAVGYNGSAIADKVDGAIETSEEADRKLKEEADRQAAGE